MNNYQYYKSIGICPICKKEKLYGDESICLECSAKKYEYYHNVYKNNKDMIKRKNEKNMDRYNRRKEEGICVCCGKEKAVKNKVSCEHCLAKRRKREIARYTSKLKLTKDERVSKGICVRCDNKVYKNFKLCKKHYDDLNNVNFASNKFRNDDFNKFRKVVVSNG